MGRGAPVGVVDPSAAPPSLRRIGRRAFKKALLGYRRAEVDEAIADRDELIGRQAAEIELGRRRVDDLERVATTLSERVVERERELREIRDALARAGAESEQTLRSLAALAEELQAVRGQARGQATRIRMRALRDATEMSDRIAELAQRPAAARERLLDSLDDAIRRMSEAADEAVPASNGYRPEAEPENVFQGLVEVEVGPLSDFAQLVGFEDAASGIGATEEISVKRFAKGRATLELHLGEPVELLRELEERAPFEFRVRDTRDDRLILDVDGE